MVVIMSELFITYLPRGSPLYFYIPYLQGIRMFNTFSDKKLSLKPNYFPVSTLNFTDKTNNRCFYMAQRTCIIF